MRNKIINLITRSYYTFLSSNLSPKDIVEFAKKNGLAYASLVDVNVMYGAYEFYNLCIKNGIKPIIGIEFVDNDERFVMIAKNWEGYQTLCRLSSMIMMKKDITLEKYLNDNVFLIALNTNKKEIKFQNLYYANSNGIENKRVIACASAICREASDFGTIQILKAIKNEQKLSLSNLKYENNEIRLKNPEELQKKYSEEQIRNLVDVVEKINLVFPNFAKNQIIKYTNSENLDSKDFLNKISLKGINKYLEQNPNLNKEIYLNRINYELNIINKHNFSDYFLVVYDFIKYAKENGITVGPGRGSAAGSLVAFALNIVEIDPIKYDLLFERFLNTDRITMPDIDTDIMDSEREKVIEYLFEKYGDLRVAHIATFAKIKIKQALRDVGRVLNIDSGLIDKICHCVKNDDEKINDLIEKNEWCRKEYLNNPELFKYSEKIMHFPRQVGVHAAGIVISNYDFTDAIAIQHCLSNKTMLQLTMDYLEDFGLVKIDILGLKNLTIIHQILMLIQKMYKKTINLHTIDLEDKKIYEMLSNKQTAGIFQFESSGMTNLLARIQPNSLEDLAVASAIFRPGAAKNIDEYISNRKRNYVTEINNKEVDEVLKKTYGMIVYQEQIIRLVQIVAKFNANKSDTFRVAISKKKEDEIKNIGNEFITAAINNGFDIRTATMFFEKMVQFASYGFNHSHALSYALISYWQAYLKYYYTLPCFSIFLKYNELNQKKINQIILEAKKFDINICLPNINISSASFTLLNRNIYFAFTGIALVGKEAAQKIIDVRNEQPNAKFTNPFKAIAKISTAGVGKNVIANLIKAGCFDSLEKNRELLLGNLDNLCDRKINIIGNDNEFIFNIKINDYEQKWENYFGYEQQTLGLGISPSLLKLMFKKYKEQYKLVHISNEENKSERFTTLINVIDIKEALTKQNKQCFNLRCIENDEQWELKMYRNEKLEKNAYYIVELSGKDKNWKIRKIIKEVKYGKE